MEHATNNRNEALTAKQHIIENYEAINVCYPRLGYSSSLYNKQY